MTKKKVVQCSCGLVIMAPYLKNHEKTMWHQMAPQALELKDRGLTFAEIARQLGVTRAYIQQRFKKLEEVAA
jgi:AraC-like DNA-binding protein